MGRENITYLFVPFVVNGGVEDQSEYQWACEIMSGQDDNWKPVNDELRYLFKYVSNKLGSASAGQEGAAAKRGLCSHFRLKSSDAPMDGTLLVTTETKYYESEEAPRFEITGTDVILFNTKIGIASVRIEFECSDAFAIASALYLLKKASAQKFRPAVDGSSGSEVPEAGEMTILGYVKSVLPAALVQGSDFFFHVDEGKGRVNILSYLEVDPKDDYKKELFYLRNCYCGDYAFYENPERDAQETYIASAETTWGITSAAAVCLECPERANPDFVRNQFVKNFNEQYYFMYVYALHQKYVLYHFLVLSSQEESRTLDSLKEYQALLYKFDSDYTFSRITEVPQYQKLYERLIQAFSLEQMFDDVREPLQELSKIETENAGKQEAVRGDKLNKAIFWLSILTVFSALIDSFDFAESAIGLLLAWPVVQVIQVIQVIFFFFIVAVVVRVILLGRR